MTRVISALLLLSAVTLPVAAQTAQALAPTEAAAFMGVWSLTLDSPQGSFEQTLTVNDEEGKVVAEISNQMQPEPQKITNISKDGSNLVLKFAGNYQGNPYD